MLYPRANILGVGVSAINLDQAVAAIDEWISNRERHYICVAAAHSLMDCYHDPNLRAIFNASGLTTPDGMSLVWLLQLHGYRGVSRVYSGDLMPAVARASVARGWRHVLYGGTAGVAEAVKGVLETKFPGIRIAAVISPPFHALTDMEDAQLVDRINRAAPDILWVSMGTGKQERWIADHAGRLNSCVTIGVGAAFDWISGRRRQAPVWMQRSGLEWLFRLASEPRRLGPRYAQYPAFAVLALAQWLGAIHFPDPASGSTGHA